MFVLIITSWSAIAQEVNVIGTVSDKYGPVAGASVVVKGLQTGTTTDSDGTFNLKVSPNATLQISFLGYIPQEVAVNGKQSLEIFLEEDTNLLDEIVVIGYGTQKRSSMTSSIASVSPKEVTKQVSSNVASALQGRAAGVDVIQTAGIAGADVNIVIRGAASLTATEPLYIIDGVFANGGLSVLNPNDIEHLEILKDGAAAAIYGSRAANGVVLITTKNGKKGEAKVDAGVSYSVQQISHIPQMLNASQWRQFANMVSDNSGLARAPENVNPTHPNTDTDWAREWLQFAPVLNANASIAGGGEVGLYSVSLGYFDQKGLTLNSDFQKYNARINTQFNKNRFSVSSNVAVTYRNKKPTTPFNLAMPTLPVKDDLGRYASWGADYYIETENARRNNPFAGLFATDNKNQTFDVIGGVNASYEFFKGLKYTMSFSGNLTHERGYTHTPIYYAMWFADGSPDEDYGNNINSLTESRGLSSNYTWDNLINFDRTFGNHSISALLGVSWMREFYRTNTIATINDLGATNITAFSDIDGKISAVESNAALFSGFARINYDFAGRYLFSASIRRDESSKFYKDSRVGYFPSVSAGWNAHEESWFKNNVVSKLKLTASYGELGANFLSPYNFDPIAFGPIPYSFNGVRYTDGRAAYLKSQDLKWETSKSTDFGIELGLFNNALQLSANYFYKKNVDLLAPVNLNLSSGQVFEINTSRETPYVNTASVENRGWEFMASYQKQLAKDWNLSIGANMTTLKNKVLALGNNVQPITAGGFSPKFNDAATITMPGYAIGSFYGYKIDGFDHEGNFAFHDENGDGRITADDKVVLGDAIPDFSYGINIDLNWKDFDLTMFFNGVAGNKIFNATRYNNYFNYSRNKPIDVLEGSWTPTNTTTSLPIAKVQNYEGGNSLPSEFYIEDGSYFRLKNVQLGYTLPLSISEKAGIDTFRIYVGVQNAFVLTKYSGYDPEVSSNALFSRGVDSNSYPNARTYTIGVNITL